MKSERVGEEEGGVKIWIGSEVVKLNISILTVWKMRAMGNYCMIRPMCEEEPKGGEMVADLLNTAGVALLLVLISTRFQLLLSQGHLLLHVADLLLGPPPVLLEEQPKQMRKV